MCAREVFMDAQWQQFFMVLGGLGIGYFAGFWKRKGENWAMKQDLAELTDIAKRVETKISNEAWSFQKGWELRRDIVFEMARKAASEVEAMTRLYGIHMTEKMNEQKGLPSRMEKRVEIGAAWNDAAAAFEGMQMIVAASCSRELLTALGEFGVFMRNLALEITSSKPEAFDASLKVLASKTNAISVGIRKELRLDGPS